MVLADYGRRPTPKPRWHPSYAATYPTFTPGPWTDGETRQVRYSSMWPDWITGDGSVSVPDSPLRMSGGPDIVAYSSHIWSRTGVGNDANAKGVPNWHLATTGEPPVVGFAPNFYGTRNIARYVRGFLDRPDIWNSEEVRVCVGEHAEAFETLSLSGGDGAFTSCPVVVGADSYMGGSTLDKATVGYLARGYSTSPSFTPYEVQNFFGGYAQYVYPVLFNVPNVAPAGARFIEIDGWGLINSVSGQVWSTGAGDMAESITIHVAAHTDRPFTSNGIWNGGNSGPVPGRTLGEDRNAAGFTFTAPAQPPGQGLQIGSFTAPPPSSDPFVTVSVPGWEPNGLRNGRALFAQAFVDIPSDPGTVGLGTLTKTADVGFLFDVWLDTPRWRWWFDPAGTGGGGGGAPLREVVDEPVRSVTPEEAFAAAGLREQRASFEPRPM